MCLRNCLGIGKNVNLKQKEKRLKIQFNLESMRIGSFQVRIYNEHGIHFTKGNTTIHKKTDWLDILIYIVCLQPFDFPSTFPFLSLFLRFVLCMISCFGQHTLTRLFSTKPWVVLDTVINEVSRFYFEVYFWLYAQDLDFNNKRLWIFGCDSLSLLLVGVI